MAGSLDPIHSGHLAIINEAYTKYNKKVMTILLNSDAWLVAKKGKPFMSEDGLVDVIGGIDIDAAHQLNQRHQKRSEFWVVSSGKCKVSNTLTKCQISSKCLMCLRGIRSAFQLLVGIKYTTKLRKNVISSREVQYGKYSTEDDIEH